MSLFKFRKKPLRAIPFVLVLAYLIWLTIAMIGFHPLETAPEPPDDREVVGVFHLHSTHSDGRADPDRIAKIASRRGLDFLVLTDHGSPNPGCLGSRGWKSGVLFLAGTEISSNRGHLVGVGFPPTIERIPRDAELADPLIRSLGGFTVIAHPYSKTGWSWGGDIHPRGVEIINADTMLKKNFAGMLPWLPALPLRPALPLLKLLSAPEKNLAKWDELNRTSQVYGFYSTDAHLLYGPMFGLLRLHVLLETPLSPDFDRAEEQVLSALGAGRFYNAVEGAAAARGFRFRAEGAGPPVPMGGRMIFQPGITLHIQTPDIEPLRIRVLRNGRTHREENHPALKLPVTEAGSYRVEVYLEKGSPLNRLTPWILSNPIAIEDESHEQH